MLIRQATANDRAGLEDCFVELQEFERSLHPNRADPHAIAGPSIAELVDDCEKTDGAILVAEEEGRIVGFVCVLSRVRTDELIELEKEYAYLSDLIVRQSYRGRGIGEQLMRAAEAHARERGARAIRVGVLATNDVAWDLYRKLGYAEYEIVLEKPIR